MTVDWSIPAAVFRRDVLLSRVQCFHSTPHLHLCTHCHRICTTDEEFWRSERQRISAHASAISGLVLFDLPRERLKHEVVEAIFEPALQAWQDRRPAVAVAAAPSSPRVRCPSCVAASQYQRRLAEASEVVQTLRRRCRRERAMPSSYGSFTPVAGRRRGSETGQAEASGGGGGGARTCLSCCIQ